MKVISKKVSSEFNGVNIVFYLKKAFSFSSTLIKKVKYGGVFINSENVHMRATVYEGDTVEVRLPEEESSGIVPLKMDIDVIFEDDYIIAVNKPSGMPTHPSRSNSLPTLAEGIMAYFSNQKFVFRAVNRLDRDTSGIVLIAKDPVSAAELSRSMKAGEFSKKYVARVVGTPNPLHDVIDAPIARECEGEVKRVVREDGKRAVTEYQVIKDMGDGTSLCEITLHTGRTHQIRVHMAYIGHPLYSDFLYGERVGQQNYQLHATELSFIHPITKEKVNLKSKESF